MTHGIIYGQMIRVIKKRFMSKQHRHESRVLPRIGRCCLAPAEGTVLLHTGAFRTTVSHLSTPAGFPAWETQTAAPRSALMTTQLHIKHESQIISWCQLEGGDKSGMLFERWCSVARSKADPFLFTQRIMKAQQTPVQFYQAITLKENKKKTPPSGAAAGIRPRVWHNDLINVKPHQFGHVRRENNSTRVS